MRRQIEALRRRVARLPRVCYTVALAAFVAALAAASIRAAAALDYVTVVDTGGARHTLLTSSKQPKEIVNLAGLSTGRHDEVVYTASGAGASEVLIKRAFPVAVLADGVVCTEQLCEGTVADLLAASDVELGPEDFVSPAPDTPLTENLMVEVNRVRYTEEVRREELAPEVVDAYKATLDEDAAFVESYNATYDVTYRDKLVNGKVTDSEILLMAPLITPRAADSYEIQEGIPCSRILGYDDVEMGPDGLPVNYEYVMEGAVCTAYSASRGRGASGLGLYCGTAAVNPNVIPYGTRMYVTSADGKFVYGFCIATDTGTAMMEGRVDLDLFFETNAECYQFGKRNMRVYILGPEPSQAEEPPAEERIT